MATSLKSIAIETQLTTSASDIVAAESNEKIFIGNVTFTNTSSSNITVTIWRLNTATTATTGSGGNWLVIKTIAPNKTWICYELMGHVLGNSEVIQSSADTASVVNVDISGTSEV